MTVFLILSLPHARLVRPVSLRHDRGGGKMDLSDNRTKELNNYVMV